jgi:hypothetical protein
MRIILIWVATWAAGPGAAATHIRTASGGNPAVFSPLSPLAVPLLLKPLRCQSRLKARGDNTICLVIRTPSPAGAIRTQNNMFRTQQSASSQGTMFPHNGG